MFQVSVINSGREREVSDALIWIRELAAVLEEEQQSMLDFGGR